MLTELAAPRWFDSGTAPLLWFGNDEALAAVVATEEIADGVVVVGEVGEPSTVDKF
jgi:hypothetical protein